MGAREAWFQKTESYLYNYRIWRGEIISWCIDRGIEVEDPYPAYASKSVVASIGSSQGTPAEVNSSTERWVIERLEFENLSPRDPEGKMPEDLKKKYRTVKKMEGAFHSLTAEEAQILQFKYFGGYKNIDVYGILCRSKNWFIDRRENLVKKVAIQLGFLAEKK